MNRRRVPLLLLGLALITGAAPPSPPLYGGRPFQAWVADLDAADLLVREEALEILTQLGPRAAVALPMIRRHLGSELLPLRTRAAVAVWRIAGDPKPAVAALTARLAEPSGRAEALATLGEMGADAIAAVADIVPFLDDPDYNARENANNALSRMGTAAVPPLLKAFESKQARIRRNVAAVLVDSFSSSIREEHLPAVTARLKDVDYRVRVDAGRLLWGANRDEHSVLSALHEGVKAGDAAVRIKVLSTLSGHGAKPAALLPLLDTAMATTDQTARVMAARLHHEIEKKADRVLPIYLDAIKDTNRSAWHIAIPGLGELGEQAVPALPRLVEILRSREGRGSQFELQATLIRIGPACVPVMVEMLRTPPPPPLPGPGLGRMRGSSYLPEEAAVQVLGALGKPAATALLQVLDDPEGQVRALRALAIIGPEANDGVPKFIELLKHKSDTVRDHAGAALGAVGPAAREAVPALLELTHDKSSTCRATAFKSLAQIGPEWKVSVKAAQFGLMDISANVKSAALGLLAQAEPRHILVVPMIVSLLKDSQQRREALALVGKLGGDAAMAVPAVLNLLKDGDDDLRRVAIEAIGEVGPAAKSTTPRLLELLRGSNRTPHQAILTTLRAVEAEPTLTIPALSEYVQQHHDQATQLGVKLLGDYGPKAAEAYPALLAVLRDAAHQPQTRAAAAVALAQVEPARARAEALADVRRLLSDNAPDLTAVRALLLLAPDDKEALAIADNALRSATAHVRGFACHELAQLGGAYRFLPAFRTLLKDPQPYVRAMAAYAVWRVSKDTAEVLPVFEGVLKDRSQRFVQGQTASVIAELGADASGLLPALSALRKNADSYNRQQAELAIRKIEAAVVKKRTP